MICFYMYLNEDQVLAFSTIVTCRVMAKKTIFLRFGDTNTLFVHFGQKYLSNEWVSRLKKKKFAKKRN